MFEMKDDVAIELRFLRTMTTADLENWQHPRMTGIRFCWKNTESRTADTVVDTDGTNDYFRFLVNALLGTGDPGAVWRAVKEVRYTVRGGMEDNTYCRLGYELNYTIDHNNDVRHLIEESLNLFNISTDIIDGVTEDITAVAGEMFIYLIRESLESKLILKWKL